MKCKKLACVFLLILMVSLFAVPVYAVDESQSYRFELSVDGQEFKEVETGEIITIALHLERTDSSDPYTMYAMQDEIQYNSEFFELVPDGILLANGVQSTDIAMRDEYREFYMNYLSFGGGDPWDNSTLIGVFQLKVTGTSGVEKIVNNDFLVSLKDGSDTYKCEANELTIFLSSECTVRFESNGGSEVGSVAAIYGELLQKPEDPTKEGKYFAGWYKDINLTDEWDFDEDTVSGNMTLYAKWSDTPVADEAPSGNLPISNLLWWILLLIIVIILIIILIFRRKKREDEDSEGDNGTTSNS